MKNNDVKKIIANTKKMAALVKHPIGFNKNNMTWQNHNKITVSFLHDMVVNSILIA